MNRLKLAILFSCIGYLIVYGIYFPQIYAYAQTTPFHWIIISTIIIVTSVCVIVNIGLMFLDFIGQYVES